MLVFPCSACHLSLNASLSLILSAFALLHPIQELRSQEPIERIWSLTNLESMTWKPAMDMMMSTDRHQGCGARADDPPAKYIVSIRSDSFFVTTSRRIDLTPSRLLLVSTSFQHRLLR
jgi:hypothetical protein